MNSHLPAWRVVGPNSFGRVRKPDGTSARTVPGPSPGGSGLESRPFSAYSRDERRGVDETDSCVDRCCFGSGLFLSSDATSGDAPASAGVRYGLDAAH